MLTLTDLINESKAEAEKARKAKSRERSQKYDAAERTIASYGAGEDNWTPIYQSVLIVDQSCHECKETISYLSGHATHAKHKKLPAWREVHRPLDGSLKLEVRHFAQTVPICAICTMRLKIGSKLYSELETQQRDFFL